MDTRPPEKLVMSCVKSKALNCDLNWDEVCMLVLLLVLLYFSTNLSDITQETPESQFYRYRYSIVSFQVFNKRILVWYYKIKPSTGIVVMAS